MLHSSFPSKQHSTACLIIPLLAHRQPAAPLCLAEATDTAAGPFAAMVFRSSCNRRKLSVLQAEPGSFLGLEGAFKGKEPGYPGGGSSQIAQHCYFQYSCPVQLTSSTLRLAP